MTKYKISIDKCPRSKNAEYESLVSEYEVKAVSDMQAILKTLDKNKIKLRVKNVQIVHENDREFTGYFDNKILYGIKELEN